MSATLWDYNDFVYESGINDTRGLRAAFFGDNDLEVAKYAISGYKCDNGQNSRTMRQLIHIADELFFVPASSPEWMEKFTEISNRIS